MTAQELQRQIDRVDGSYKSLQARRDSLDKEIQELKKNTEHLTKVSLVMKHLLDVLVRDEIKKTAGLVTYGLKSIFTDQELIFSPNICKKNDKVHIELKTTEVKGDKKIEGSYRSFGGSVMVIEDFLLRIICILKKKMARLMLLDETFVPVSKEYIPNTSKLINELCDRLGMDVLLVTHQESFQEHAKHIYRAEPKDNSFFLRRLK